MRRVQILALGMLAGCGSAVPRAPQAPRVPGPLVIAPAPAPPAGGPACEVGAPDVVDDPRWAPATSGPLALVDVRGEPRLSVDHYALPAWSPDGTLLALGDGTAVTIWRASDGALVDLVRYPGGPVAPNDAAWSRDGRWLAIDGTRRHGSGEVGVTVVIDRAARPQPQVRELARGLGKLAFSPDGATLAGEGGDLELASWRVTPHRGRAARGTLVRLSAKRDAIELVDPASGAVRRLTAFDTALSAMALVDGGARLVVARPGALEVYDLPAGTLARHLALPGTEAVALSADGRYVAGWTLARVELLGAHPGEAPAPPRPVPAPFLAAWDVASGRQLWRDPTRCCDRWRFSPDGEWLVPPLGRLGSELIRAATGQVVTFPGGVFAVSPDGKLATVGTRDGMELWSTAGARVVAPPHGAEVVARSASGATVEHLAEPSPLGRGILTDLGRGADVLVDGAHCTTVFAHGGEGDEFAFSPDGARLYAAQATPSGTRAGVWHVGDGKLLHAMRSSKLHHVSLMPALGRFGFDVVAGIRIVDALTGRELASAPAPRVRYSDGPGLVWDVRDPDGDRTSGFGPLLATPDGRYLVGSTVLEHEVVTIWDLQDVRATVDLPAPGLVSALAVSPDGQRIAAGDRAGHVVLWTRPDRTPRRLPHGHGWVRAVAFSPDGALLASGGDDGIVRVADAATGAPRGTATLVADRPLRLTWLDDHTLAIDTARHLVVTVALRGH